MSVPGPPVIVVAPRSSANTLEFAWRPPATGGTATSYRFQLESETAVILTENDFYYKVTGLVNGQLYTASIEAGNINGYGPKAFFRTFAPGTTAPNAPATATAATSGTSNALVTWTPPSALPDSEIYWYVIKSNSTNSSDPIKKITADGITQRSYFIEGLNRNSQYSFDIQAVNCPGYSLALRTNSIQFFNQGEVKLATRSGNTTTGALLTNIACDTNGNTYQVIDWYTGGSGSHSIYNYTSAPVSGGTVGTTLAGTVALLSNHALLIKYDSTGTAQWVTYLRKGGETARSQISTDSDGNVYVAFTSKSVSTKITIYNGATLSGGTFTPAAYGELPLPNGAVTLMTAIVKYNSSGTVQWTTCIQPSDTTSEEVALTVDTSGNLYVSVPCRSATIRVYNYSSAPSPPVTGNIGVTLYGTYTRQGTNIDGFMVKYNTSGAAQWAVAVGNLRSSAGTVYPGVAVNSSTGDVYLANSASLTSPTAATIYSWSNTAATVINTSSFGTIASPSSTTISFILVKYNSSGVAQWATIMTNGTNAGNAQLSVDGSGNVYVVTVWAGTSNQSIFNFTTVSGTITTTQNGYVGLLQGGNSVIIIKYNSSGTALRATSTSGNFNNKAFGKCSCDTNGNLYVAFEGEGNLPLRNYSAQPATSTSEWGTTSIGVIATNGTYDNYIVKYTTDLAVSWGARVGGTNQEFFPALDLDGQGNVWITGIYATNPVPISNFSSPLTFSGGAMVLSTYGTLPTVLANITNTFLVKYTA